MNRKLREAVLLLIVVIFVSCSKVELPENKIVDMGANQEVNDLKSKLPMYPEGKIEYQEVANEKKVKIKKGDKNLYGVKITKDLKKVYDAYLSGDGESALETIAKIKKESDDPLMQWQVSFLKIQVLMMMGLGDEAVEELETCSMYEKEVFNSDLNTIALRAELNVWLENLESAKRDAEAVLLTIGDWEFPTKYAGPPTNMPELVATTTAQLRAYTTLAAIYNLKENYEESYYWANEAEKRMNAVFYVANHVLYGKFVNLTLDAYYGRATNLTFLATAKLGLAYDDNEVEEEFQKAVDFYELVNYKKGIATVLAFKARTYNKTGRYDMCYEIGKEAVDYSLENGFLDFVWRIEAIRGDTFAELGYPEEAEKAYRRANDTIIKLTKEHSTEVSKIRFGIGKNYIKDKLMEYEK